MRVQSDLFDSFQKNPTKKSESDADVIELDDEGDEEIDDVEEPSQVLIS